MNRISNSEGFAVNLAGVGNIGKVCADILSQRSDIAALHIADPLFADSSSIPPRYSANPKVCVYNDYNELPPSSSVVVIALPNDMHRQAFDFFASTARRLLVEKPLGNTYAESALIAKNAKDTQTPTMCGLTGLYHPEFRAMYEALSTLGHIKEVRERIHEANSQLHRFLHEGHGVLTENGIHTLHRFYKIASLIDPTNALEVKEVALSKRYFRGCAGEDYAAGRLMLGNIPFTFELSFRDGTKTDNGWPIDYRTEIIGEKGTILVTGWEKCETNFADGTHEVHYAHPDGPLQTHSQYSRIRRGLEDQINEFLRFALSGEQQHFTLGEAVQAHRLVEECYAAAR